VPEPRALLKTVLSYGTVSAATAGAMFLLHVVAGRFLGVEHYGYFSFALALGMMIAPILDPGLYYLLIREVARDHEAAPVYLAHALTWKLVVGPVLLLLVLGAGWVLDTSPLLLYAVALLAVAQVLHSLKEAFRPTLLGLERFGLDALTLAIERVSLLVFGSLVLLAGHGLIGLCWVFVVVRVLDLLVLAVIVGRRMPVRIGGDLGALRSVLRAALPIGAFYITLNIYNYVDVVMLSWLRNAEEVGWYAAAYRLYEGPFLIPAIIGTIFMPRLSRLFGTDPGGFRGTARQGLQWVMLVSVVSAAVGILLADWLVTFTYGTDYAASAAALKILLTGLLFAFTIHFLQTALIAIDRQRLVLVAAGAGLAANVGLNLVLIPAWGFHGAAVATVAVEGLVFGLLVTSFWRLARQTRAEPVASSSAGR
jgi:O-antigen/teichoic acid export membrane protein